MRREKRPHTPQVKPSATVESDDFSTGRRISLIFGTAPRRNSGWIRVMGLYISPGGGSSPPSVILNRRWGVQSGRYRRCSSELFTGGCRRYVMQIYGAPWSAGRAGRAIRHGADPAAGPRATKARAAPAHGRLTRDIDKVFHRVIVPPLLPDNIGIRGRLCICKMRCISQNLAALPASSQE